MFWRVAGSFFLILLLVGSWGAAGGRATNSATPPASVQSPGSLLPIHGGPTNASSSGILGGNWPTYLGNPERTSANLDERTLSATNISQLRLQWSIAMNGSGFGSVTVNNGTAYIGSWDGYEYAVNTSNGHILWKSNLGLSSSCYVSGIDSNAAVWNGTVYVGGGDDHWYALNAINGSVEWSFDVLKFGGITGGNFDWASPLLYDGFEYIGVASCSDSPLVHGMLLQVNLTGNHTPLHRFHVVPVGQLGGDIWSTPSVDPATNTIWVTTGNEGQSGQSLADAIVALNATTLSLIGSWEVPNVVGLDDDFGAGATLFHDANGRPLVAATNKNGEAYALSRANVTTNGTWKPIWNVSTGGQFAPGAFDGAQLYLGGGAVTIRSTSYSASVLSIDPATGHRAWLAGVNGTVYGAPVYANGLVAVGAGPDLYVLNATNGQLLKMYPIKASTESIECAPSIVAGRVFFASGSYGTTGHAYALDLPLGANFSVRTLNSTPPGYVGFQALAQGGAIPYNFTWIFGDGRIGYGPSPLHPYSTGGNVTVNLSIRDAAGGVANASQQVLVPAAPAPVAAQIRASTSRGTIPFPVTFNATAQNGFGPVGFTWNFGDGSTGFTGPNDTHTYSAPGTFHVHLTATDIWGRAGNDSATVIAVGPFVLGVTADPMNGTAPLNVSFSDLVAGGLAPFRYSWSFGDGSPPSFAPAIEHEFVSPGNYTVTDQVWDATNRTETRTVSINASAIPVVATPLSSALFVTVLGSYCLNQTTLLGATGSASGGTPPYAYAWEFGDGSPTVYGQQMTHSYLRAGNFVVRLNVTDLSGQTSESTSSASIGAPVCPHAPAQHVGSASPSTLTTELVVLAVAAVLVVGVAIAVLSRRRR